jgi:hypothetical protein
MHNPQHGQKPTEKPASIGNSNLALCEAWENNVIATNRKPQRTLMAT